MLGMRTLIVSVLPLRLLALIGRRLLVLLLLLRETWVICRRRECMLFCFFSARTGLMVNERVPRLR